MRTSACCGWSRTACSMDCASITSTACSIPRPTCSRLQRRVAARRGGGHFYLVVEKILSAHESLREDWPIDGTTGYDFLNQVTRAAGRSGRRAGLQRMLRAVHRRAAQPFGEIVRLCKLHIMDNEMAGELNVLARDMARLARQNPRTADFTQNLLRRAIKELIACFPVYRTYMDGQGALDSRRSARLWAGHCRRRAATRPRSIRAYSAFSSRC